MTENREVEKISRRDFIKRGGGLGVGLALMSKEAKAFLRGDYRIWGTEAKEMAEWIKKFRLFDPYGAWDFQFIPGDLKRGEASAHGVQIFHNFRTVDKYATDEKIVLAIDIRKRNLFAITEIKYLANSVQKKQYSINAADDILKIICYQENKWKWYTEQNIDKRTLSLRVWTKNDRQHAALIDRYQSMIMPSDRLKSVPIDTSQSVVEFSIDSARQNPQLKSFELVKFGENHLPVVYCYDFNISRKAGTPFETFFCMLLEENAATRRFTVRNIHQLSSAVRPRKADAGLWLVTEDKSVSINPNSGKLMVQGLRTDKTNRLLGREIERNSPLFISLSEKIKKYFQPVVTIDPPKE